MGNNRMVYIALPFKHSRASEIPGNLLKMQFLILLLVLGSKDIITGVDDATGPWSCLFSNKGVGNTELKQFLSNDVTLNLCPQL